jgi:hypothetical protein
MTINNGLHIRIPIEIEKDYATQYQHLIEKQ